VYKRVRPYDLLLIKICIYDKIYGLVLYRKFDSHLGWHKTVLTHILALNLARAFHEHLISSNGCFIYFGAFWVEPRLLSSILAFRVMTPCSLVGGYQRFRGMYRLPSQTLTTYKTTLEIFTDVRNSNLRLIYW
jgi:hypothetical protein